MVEFKEDANFNLCKYCIAGKFGEELNLVVWRIDQPTAKLIKSTNIKFDCTHTVRLRIDIVQQMGVVFGLQLFLY